MFNITANTWFPIDRRYGSFVEELVSFDFMNNELTEIDDIELTYLNRLRSPEYFIEGSPFSIFEGDAPLLSAAEPNKIILKKTAVSSGS